MRKHVERPRSAYVRAVGDLDPEPIEIASMQLLLSQIGRESEPELIERSRSIVVVYGANRALCRCAVQLLERVCFYRDRIGEEPLNFKNFDRKRKTRRALPSNSSLIQRDEQKVKGAWRLS